MGIIDKVFQSGDDAAVILPKDIAFAPGTLVMFERDGDVLTVKPVVEFDHVAEKRKVTELVAALRGLEPVGEIEQRELFDLPERPGM